MRGFVFVAVAAAVGCKGDKTIATPAGAKVLASCDYRAKIGAGEAHTCTEVFDEAFVDAQKTWCEKLKTPRDFPTFAKDTPCPAAGRKRGCLEPNGNIRWRYDDQGSCVLGVEFVDAVPPRVTNRYRCAKPELCIDYWSVIDLTKQVEAKNCETSGSTFSTGTCPTEKVAARCRSLAHDRLTVWNFYEPLTKEQSAGLCRDIEGILE